MNARTHFVCTIEGCDQPHDAKGLCRHHYKKLKRHGNPLNPPLRAPDGAGWLDRKGYRLFTVNGKARREHVMIAEVALGRALPSGAVVHHADENPANNSPSNLVICPSNKYHRLLHQRLDAMKACGNPNWRKCPYCRSYDDPANMRGEQCGRFVHPNCSARAKRESLSRRRAA